jgi:predicted DNA-binding transcriptional regulator AlpA
MKMVKTEKRNIEQSPKEHHHLPPERKLRKILRKRVVMDMLGLGHSALAEAVARGDLPKPVQITAQGRVVGWFEDEIIEHQEKRAKARDADERIPSNLNKGR